MKRLVVCCDGTWKKLDSRYPTNVVKISQAVKPIASDGTHQVIFYDEGVGTEGGINTLLGGAFGGGIDKNIQDAYRFLSLNYIPGDEIYLFGFSRGAYTVRSLAGLIYNSGLLTRSHIRQAVNAYELYRESTIKPNDPQMVGFRQKYCIQSESNDGRAPITLLGCWDTVGSLGIPEATLIQKLSKRYNQRYRFHDVSLSPIIQHALHAVAIDELRKVFCVTPMEKSRRSQSQVVRQVWFPGDHSSVGGGAEEMRGLSDCALNWMMNSIQQLGLSLELDPEAIPTGIQPDPSVDWSSGLVTWFTQLGGVALRELSEQFEDLDESVVFRWHKRQDYRPQNLVIRHGDKLGKN